MSIKSVEGGKEIEIAVLVVVVSRGGCCGCSCSRGCGYGRVGVGVDVVEIVVAIGVEVFVHDITPVMEIITPNTVNMRDVVRNILLIRCSSNVWFAMNPLQKPLTSDFCSWSVKGQRRIVILPTDAYQTQVLDFYKQASVIASSKHQKP